MATIVFYISTLQGEFNGSIKVAKTLHSLGYKVFYLGYLDSEEKVRQHGFYFMPILEKWLPKGFFQQQDNNNLNFSGLRLWLEQRKKGGAHTINECIFFGVPTIVFPVIADQPENVEKIEYHGLGVAGKIKNTSVSLIIDLVDKIENDFLLKQQVEAWKNKFRERENFGKAAKFILEILEQNKRI